MSEITESTETRWVIRTRVSCIEERYSDQYFHGVGKEAVFSKHFLGWFIGFDGSHELLHIGHTRPDIHLGDKIKITIQKEVSDAKSGQTPIE